jgi:hypothetical protein
MMQQLAAILNLRPDAWGLEYCPSLREDLAKLADLCGDASLRSQDWLLEGKRAQLSPTLTPFFAGLQSRAYFDEARIYRRVVRAALRTGLQFGGYLDGNLQAHTLAEAVAGSGLWAVTEGGGMGRYQPPDGGGKPHGKFAPYSPLFFVPIDLHAVVAEAIQRIGVRPNTRLPAIPILQQ